MVVLNEINNTAVYAGAHQTQNNAQGLSRGRMRNEKRWSGQQWENTTQAHIKTSAALLFNPKNKYKLSDTNVRTVENSKPANNLKTYEFNQKGKLVPSRR